MKESCKELQDTKADLESKLAQTTSILSDQCQAVERDLDQSDKDLRLSRKSCQGLQEELLVAKEVCAELEAVKSQQETRVEELEAELAAERLDFNKQISGMEKCLERAEVLITNALCEVCTEKRYQEVPDA